MLETSIKLLRERISESAIKEIDQWIAKYPSGQKQSAVMRSLMIVQEEHGYLSTELMDAVAEYLDMSPISVYEVATFYSMYELKPCGRHIINVCTDISCKLKGAEKVVEHLEEVLMIKLGETTADNRFTLRSVECLAACVNAPMLQIDKDYHENLTSEKINSLLEKYQ